MKNLIRILILCGIVWGCSDKQMVTQGSINENISSFQIKKTNHGEVMDFQDVQKKWGYEKFDANAFRKGDLKIRAAMAGDLLMNKVYVGKAYQKVYDDLGSSDGYFFDDIFLSYEIERSHDFKNDWQVVFLRDHEGCVKDILVQKQGTERKSTWYQDWVRRIKVLLGE